MGNHKTQKIAYSSLYDNKEKFQRNQIYSSGILSQQLFNKGFGFNKTRDSLIYSLSKFA